jgi:pimeloyl-ACP methyl ester carboxylesterase
MTTPEPVLEKTDSADRTPIAYWRSGHGPALVLVHGMTADHTRWEGVLPLLEPHVTVYAMDRRGRGASGDGPRHSLTAEAADVAAVVEAVAAATGQPVDLFGHSYGATCALEAALLTTRLRRLVIYEPGLAVTTDRLVDRLAALLAQGRPEDVVIALLHEAGMPPDQLERARLSPSWPGRVAAAHTVVRECRAEQGYRLEPDRFAAVRAPTLFLTGSESPPEIAGEAELLAGAMPDARVGTLDGQGHVAMATAPDLFAEQVLVFLRSPLAPVPAAGLTTTGRPVGRRAHEAGASAGHGGCQ